jgi:hypothetical protein
MRPGLAVLQFTSWSVMIVVCPHLMYRRLAFMTVVLESFGCPTRAHTAHGERVSRLASQAIPAGGPSES